jgi:methionyl-tRNA synthetase
VNAEALDQKFESRLIDREDFRTILRSEIGNILSAILSETQENYIEAVTEEIKDSDEREKEKELIRKKFDIVEEILADKRIRDKYRVVVTSKLDSLVDVSWEISEKRYDGDERLNLSYATIKLDFTASPSAGFYPLRPFSSLALLFGEGPSSLTFNCSLAHIDDLIKILTDIREKLEEVQAEK